MKQILVVSGKGGTGKTLLTSSLAVIVENKIMVDCDVDAANLNILLNNKIEEQFDFYSGKKAHIDQSLCIKCNMCKRSCRFEAINNKLQIEEIFCEGCALCSHICPVNAIKMIDNLAGQWFISSSRFGKIIHAKLGIAQGNSGKLVTQIRKAAYNIAKENNNEYIIIDGPPGIGCPVIASFSDIDKAVIVTEPTLSAIHDMDRLIKLCRNFNTEMLVVINKFTINEEKTKLIESLCNDNNIKIIGYIPFCQEIADSISEGIPFIEKFKNHKISLKIENIWRQIAKF